MTSEDGGKDRPDTRDIILAIIDAKGGTIRGRTVLQKLVFFADHALSLKVPFEPYLYGPYSDDVAISTDSLVASDFIDEDAMPIEICTEAQPALDLTKPIKLSTENYPVFDPKVYEYRLTESGEKIVEARKKKIPVYEGVRRVVAELEASGLDIQSANVLAVAAKTIYIVEMRHGAKKPLGVHDIATIGKDLGWEIPEDLIGKVLKSLEKLGMIRLVNP